VQNGLIDVSTECAVFIRRVRTELFGGKENRQQYMTIARITSIHGKGKGEVQTLCKFTFKLVISHWTNEIL
jgi:hypothetical protein